MDKFYGINRAEITAVNHSHATSTDGIPVISRKDFCAKDCRARDCRVGDTGDRHGRFWTKSRQKADFSANDSADFADSFDSANGFTFSDGVSDSFSDGSLRDYDYCRKTKSTNPQSDKTAKNGKQGAGKNGSKVGVGVFTALRYGLCAALLLVCAMGKFWAGSPLTEASGFIKDQLDRDIIREISEDATAKE